MVPCMKAGINAMDSTLTSVLADLSGSVIGATTPVLSNFVLQRSVTQRELTNREIAQREELYSEFITKGTSCYAKALSQSLDNIDELAAIYALVNRIRLFASSSVLEAADVFVKILVERYDDEAAPLVVIVGGGFGALAAAKGLKRSRVNVLLIDRRIIMSFSLFYIRLQRQFWRPAR